MEAGIKKLFGEGGKYVMQIREHEGLKGQGMHHMQFEPKSEV